MSNVTIPAPGSKGIAVVKNVEGGIEVVQVHVYAPDGKARLTLDGSFMNEVFSDESSARAAVSKAIANNPVHVINLKDL
ncbi:hypothetical protein M0638_19315 [Roseomonas sp. NAR14]|uniref:Uncharacterized protein n=1 Tax=Roseomonas acroporae TaxID=2937791 RepID=A0A9X1YCK2_9PROT|nr:hypothetical protein [Roseomonas acroporae]MCK8786530.1 hypothetical protein [Roseomonas acroporae]